MPCRRAVQRDVTRQNPGAGKGRAPVEASSGGGRDKSRTGTLGGSNRMLSAAEVGELLGVPELSVRDKWREWGLRAYKIGKHLRWREREVLAWIDRQAL